MHLKTARSIGCTAIDNNLLGSAMACSRLVLHSAELGVTRAARLHMRRMDRRVVAMDTSSSRSIVGRVDRGGRLLGVQLIIILRVR